MRRTLPLLLWILFAASPLFAQEATTKTEGATLRVEPDGVTLASIDEGAPLAIGAEREGWREVTLTGWIWAPSVRPDKRPGFDLVVSARNGENLRAAPNGDRIARINRGTLLVEIERDGRWVRVKRTGWVEGSLLIIGEQKDSRASANDLPSAPNGEADSGPATAGEAVQPGPEEAGASELLLAPGSSVRAGQAGARLLASPEGDSVAVVKPLSELEVVEQRGEWVRVRVEGWVPAPALESSADTGATLRGIAPEVLRSNPDAFRGRVVEWRIQFITFDRAEKIRADFTEGELFILARPPGDQPGFVYLAVPEEFLQRIESLRPLEWVDVVARVRTGRSAQMAAPVLELIEIR